MVLLPLLLACDAAPEGPFALSFDGAPDCGTVDLSEAPPDSFTVDAWVRGDPDAFDAMRPIVLWNQVFNLSQNASGQLLFTVGPDGVGAAYVFSVLDGVLHHVSGAYDGGDGSVRLFVDGAFVGSSGAAAFTGEEPDDRIQFGCARAATEGFYGLIDEVRISSVARQVDDFEPPTGPYRKDADTWMLFHFDEGTGDTALSETGGYEMVLTDTEWAESELGGEG
jgi:hypothetical protein